METLHKSGTEVQKPIKDTINNIRVECQAAGGDLWDKLKPLFNKLDGQLENYFEFQKNS